MLRKVRGLAPGNVWAAGTYYSASAQHYQTLVVHFNGKAWTTGVSADAPTASHKIIGLAAAPDGSALSLVGRQGPDPLIEQANCATGAVSRMTADNCAAALARALHISSTSWASPAASS